MPCELSPDGRHKVGKLEYAFDMDGKIKYCKFCLRRMFFWPSYWLYRVGKLK